MATTSTDLKTDAALAKARKELRELRLKYRKLQEANGGYDAFVEELRGIISDEDTFKFGPKSNKPLAKKLDYNETACVALSDLHLTEVVRPEDSCGINTYNSVIAAARLWHYAQSVKSILSRHSKMYTISDIWCPMLGDMVNGTIHLDGVMYNDLTDPAAVILASRLLFMFFKELGTLGVPIQIDAVHGNHPRLTPKMPTKRQAHTNLDWLIYETLYDKLGKDGQIALSVHTSQIGLRKLRGWNYVFEHGIGVSSNKEEALESRVRDLLDDPTFRKATGHKGTSFDQLIIGNTHKARFLERTVVNGCFTGQNELGMSWRLKPVEATQLIWGASDKRPRTWQYQIDLTEVVDEAADNPMSEYTLWFLRRYGR